MILLYGAPVLNPNETISYHGTFTEIATVPDPSQILGQIDKIVKYDILQAGSAYITHAINVEIKLTPINDSEILICITGNYVHITTK